ncbi:MAG: hypothetical protein RIR96_1310 [Bacteroidota bacterium]|jgi:glycosyltransferase involved in cell wall biosynthesis
MKVSVLLLSFNQADLIAAAIEGVINQKTNFSFELLISDDCSSDHSRSIIEDYHKRFPHVIKPFFQQENLGPKNNDYFLFQKSQGEYLCYCEADDFWCNENKLQMQVEFLDGHPDYGLVHGDVNFLFSDSGKFIQSYNKTNNIEVKSGDIYNELLLGNHYIKTMTVCYRKKIMADHYFTDDYIRNSNWMMIDLSQWLCIASCSKIHYLKEVLATYRLRSESMSRSKSSLKMHHFHLDIFDIRFHFMQKYQKHSEATLARVNEMYVNMLVGDAYKLSDWKIIKKAIQFARVKKVILKPKILIKLILLSVQVVFLGSKHQR